MTLLRASADPLDTKVAAEVQLFPGRRIICVVALRETVFKFTQASGKSRYIPGLTNGRNSSLYCTRPEVDIGDIMRFVHSKEV